MPTVCESCILHEWLASQLAVISWNHAHVYGQTLIESEHRNLQQMNVSLGVKLCTYIILHSDGKTSKYVLYIVLYIAISDTTSLNFLPQSGPPSLALHSNSPYIFQSHNHTLTSCSSLKDPSANTHPWHPPASVVGMPNIGATGFAPLKITTTHHSLWSSQQMEQKQGSTIMLCVDWNVEMQRESELEQMSLIMRHVHQNRNVL